MPEKHLFVNSLHYQDRPDPNMRHKIASHAAKYGPNGSLAFKTSPECMDEAVHRSTSRSSDKSSPNSSQSTISTSPARSASLTLTTPIAGDVFFRHEVASARLSDFCICADNSPGGSPSTKEKAAHAKECSLLENYLMLTNEHELPFRMTMQLQLPAFNSPAALVAEGLVLQCLLVAGQVAVDGMDPKFRNQPSNRTLTLQQRALTAMRKAISRRHNAVDDSIVVASAIMLSIAVETSESFCTDAS